MTKISAMPGMAILTISMAGLAFAACGLTYNLAAQVVAALVGFAIAARWG